MNVSTTSGRYSDRYNEEGYLDMTAYKAMQGGSMNEWERGDIVEWERNNGSYGEAVIISPHERFATAVELYENEATENNHKIASKAVMNADAGKLITLHYNRITQLIKAMDDKAFEKLLEHVGVCLGTTREVEKEVVKEVPKVMRVEVPADETAHLVAMAKLEAERDTFKALYMGSIKGGITA